jgi:hypothetical protein
MSMLVESINPTPPYSSSDQSALTGDIHLLLSMKMLKRAQENQMNMIKKLIIDNHLEKQLRMNPKGRYIDTYV